VVTGGDELELLIELDETKLLADRLEVNQVAQAIQNANVNASAAGSKMAHDGIS